MCEHKNLRTVGDRLFCKDCKEELPLEFLTEGQKPIQEKKKPDIQPAEKEESAIPAPKKERAKTTRKTAKKGE